MKLDNTSNIKKNTPSKKLIWLALLVPSFLVVLALWLPFGFALTGLIEEWGVMGLFVDKGVFFVTHIHSPMAPQAIRPLTIFPHALAYFLDPDSFNYWHVLLMLSLIVRGASCSHLIWKATGSLRFAMIMGVLVLLYPADTMQLTFRGIHINWAISLVLLASSTFVVACEQQRATVSFILSVAAAALLFAANCMYEATVPLIFCPFLILFTKEGFRTFHSKLGTRKNYIIIWMATVLLYLIYASWAYFQVDTGQASLLRQGNPIKNYFFLLPKLFTVGVFRSLIGGWFDAIRMVATEFDSYIYLTSMAIVIGVVVLFIINDKTRNKISSTSENARFLPLRLMFAGLLLLLLGYSSYLVSFSYLITSQRTFLCATPGAAMVCIALLMMLARYSMVLSNFVTAMLIFFGLGAQLFQFHYYVQLSQSQRILLKSIVENFDGNLGNKTLILLDKSNQLNRTWMFLVPNLYGALDYLYGKPIKNFEVCYMPSREWQHGDSTRRMGTCIEGKHEWIFHSANVVTGPGNFSTKATKDQKISKDRSIVISISDNPTSLNTVQNSYKESLLKDNTDVARRYRGVLEKKNWWPDFQIFKDQKIQDHYQWYFGKWWSLDLPIHGSGWHEAEWEVSWLKHKARAWKMQEKSSLYFNLAPISRDYVLRGEFYDILNEAIKKSIKIRLNDHDIAYQWVGDKKFKAVIPAQVLLSGTNKIEFNSKIDPTFFGLSASLIWFEVKKSNNINRES